jgi:hypothetical protein
LQALPVPIRLLPVLACFGWVNARLVELLLGCQRLRRHILSFGQYWFRAVGLLLHQWAFGHPATKRTHRLG